MKQSLLLLAFAVLFGGRGFADSLTWEYTHGWTKGYVVTVSGEKGVITLHDRNDDTKKVAKIVNAENILLYIDGLLKRIPEDGVGKVAADGERNTIKLTTEDAVTKRMVYMVDPPGFIVLNSDYSAAKELANAEEFRKNIDGYLVREVLFQLVRNYFPPDESKEAEGNPKSERAADDQSSTRSKVDE